MRQEALDWFSEGEADPRRTHKSVEIEDFAWACFEAINMTEGRCDG